MKCGTRKRGSEKRAAAACNCCRMQWLIAKCNSSNYNNNNKNSSSNNNSNNNSNSKNNNSKTKTQQSQQQNKRYAQLAKGVNETATKLAKK